MKKSKTSESDLIWASKVKNVIKKNDEKMIAFTMGEKHPKLWVGR